MLALVNGDYQPRGNGLRTVTGDAEQYVVEALADEAGLKVDSVALAESGGTAKLTVCVSVNGTQMTVEAALQ